MTFASQGSLNYKQEIFNQSGGVVEGILNITGAGYQTQKIRMICFASGKCIFLRKKERELQFH